MIDCVSDDELVARLYHHHNIYINIIVIIIIMKSIIIWKFQGKHGGCQVQLPGERKDVSSSLDCTRGLSSSSSLYLYHYCVILRIIITITLPDRTWGLSYVPWSPSWSSSSLSLRSQLECSYLFRRCQKAQQTSTWGQQICGATLFYSGSLLQGDDGDDYDDDGDNGAGDDDETCK